MGKTYWRYGVTNQAHAVGRTCLSQQSRLALGTVTERKSNCYDVIILVSFPNFEDFDSNRLLTLMHIASTVQ